RGTNHFFLLLAPARFSRLQAAQIICARSRGRTQRLRAWSGHAVLARNDRPNSIPECSSNSDPHAGWSNRHPHDEPAEAIRRTFRLRRAPLREERLWNVQDLVGSWRRGDRKLGSVPAALPWRRRLHDHHAPGGKRLVGSARAATIRAEVVRAR